MRLLLDTHVALWSVSNDPRLSEAARELIGGSPEGVFVSAISIWGIAIKHAFRHKRHDAMVLSGT